MAPGAPDRNLASSVGRVFLEIRQSASHLQSVESVGAGHEGNAGRRRIAGPDSLQLHSPSGGGAQPRSSAGANDRNAAAGIADAQRRTRFARSDSGHREPGDVDGSFRAYRTSVTVALVRV